MEPFFVVLIAAIVYLLIEVILLIVRMRKHRARLPSKKASLIALSSSVLMTLIVLTSVFVLPSRLMWIPIGLIVISGLLRTIVLSPLGVEVDEDQKKGRESLIHND